MECCSFTVLIVIVLLLVNLRVFLKCSIKWNESATCLVGKTAIVTGANTGIGFATAQDLASRGARVILACRDRSKGEKAKSKIIESTENYNIVVKILDLNSFKSIREFVKEIKDTEENLHILVNNAGVGQTSIQPTEDGLNLLFQANYLGPFLLTNLLIDLMKKSKWGRVVNVSSSIAHVSKLDPDNLGVVPKCRFSDTIHYSNSKLCNIIFANELARKLSSTCIRANSLNPGSVRSQILKDLPGFVKPVVNIISKLFFRTWEEGAQTSIYLAVSKRIEDVTGEFFDNCEIGRMPKIARSEVLAAKVWDKSEELVKLTPEERHL